MKKRVEIILHALFRALVCFSLLGPCLRSARANSSVTPSITKNGNSCAANHLAPRGLHFEQENDGFKKLQEAKLKSLQAALAKDPSDLATRNELANVLTILSRKTEAVARYNELLAAPLSATQRAATLNNLGNYYFLQDSVKQAEAHYHRALQADSTAREVYLNLGTLYTAVEDSALANEAFQHFVFDSTQISVAEALLDIVAEESRHANGGDLRRLNTANLKHKVHFRVLQAGGKPPKAKKGKPARPFAKKGNLSPIGVAAYAELEGLLYWAKLK